MGLNLYVIFLCCVCMLFGDCLGHMACAVLFACVFVDRTFPHC